MLAQTQVARVVPRWERFLSRWPTPTSCAGAPLADLLVEWQGLGYPRRCRNLHDAARIVVDRHGGRVPDALDDLLALPGVGAYTARAVLTFAFERHVGVVDTNIARIHARLAGRRLPPAEAQRLADGWVPPGRSWEWNQTLMDVGATLCRPVPMCEGCPLRADCTWRGSAVEPDPSIGSAGVSGRQAAYHGSDRQLRGRVMASLTSGEPVGTSPAGVDDARWLHVLGGLVDDGLIVRSSAGWALPGVTPLVRVSPGTR